MNHNFLINLRFQTIFFALTPIIRTDTTIPENYCGYSENSILVLVLRLAWLGVLLPLRSGCARVTTVGVHFF